ncbi:hypothetical protein ACH33_11830 [Aneurinibacillus sp. XH2]|nr:hypothetical protein ACH33_11830 [Aneurinibacillus sp. XH2]
MEMRAGYGNVELISPYEVQRLNEIKIVKTVNDHAKLYVTGIIPEEQQDFYIEMANSTDTVKVNQVENGRIVRPLFSGQVSHIEIKAVRGIYYIELEARSHTCRMDVKRKSRSFQNKDMLYTDLIETILANYSGSDYIDTVSETSKLRKCIIQYEETDWQFLKRMASHFGAVLLPEATADAPKFWFGMPEGRPGELWEHQYSVKKTLPIYMKTTENDYAAGLSGNDFLYYRIESEAYFNLGDRITYKGKERVVAESTAVMKNGTMTYEYILASEKGIRQNLIFNDQITGASLEGKILDVAKDTVKIHLDIDKTQDKNEACWFPYSTPYTAESNSGWYCMPELGDTVKLYIPGNREEEAVAICSIRRGQDRSPKVEDPTIKYWGTPHGKEMMLGGQELIFTAKEEGIFLKLHEEDGIEIHSEKPIVFTSEKDLKIDAGNELSVQAQEAVYMVCGASSMMLDGITDIQGLRVEMEGTVKGPVVVDDLIEEEEAPQKEWEGDRTELAQHVAGLIPGSGDADGNLQEGGKDIARTVAACVPFVGEVAARAKMALKAVKAKKAGRKT